MEKCKQKVIKMFEAIHIYLSNFILKWPISCNKVNEREVTTIAIFFEQQKVKRSLVAIIIKIS